jgi:SWI/SNF-related matrix-associated actin-dependent regulator of chromatin subfamily A containing DEAD/H box 1
MALDEAHSIKNAGTSKYRKLLQMPCTRRILLTGTPINNSLPELLVLLQFLMPETFDPDDERLISLFDEAAALKKHEPKSKPTNKSAKEQSGGGGEREEEEGQGGRMRTFFERLKLIVRPFILRRCKTDVLHELVDKVQKVEQVTLPAAQQAVYTSIIHRHVAQSQKSQNTGRGTNKSQQATPMQGIQGMNQKLIQNIFAELRKAANHPLLVRSKFSDEQVQEIGSFLLQSGHFGTQCKLEQVLKEMRDYSDFNPKP